MDAYTLVDNQIRKKLEEMLHTWKQSPVGAPSSAPVFPPEITRKIENALIKAKTVAISLQQKEAKRQQERMVGIGRSTTPSMPYRSSPMPVSGIPALNGLLPDGGRDGYGLPARNTVSASESRLLLSSHTISRPIQPVQVPSHTPTPQPQAQAQQFSYSSAQSLQSLLQSAAANLAPSLPPVDSLGTLKNDISSLIESVQRRFSENIHDPEIRMKLHALFELQKIVEREQLAPDQIALIRSQLSSMSISNSPAPAPPPAPPASVPAPVGTPLAAFLQSVSAGPSVPAPAPSATPIPNLSTAALAELLKSTLTGGASSLPLPPPPPPPQPLSISSSTYPSIPAIPPVNAAAPPFMPQFPFMPGLLPQPGAGGFPPLPPPSADTAALFAQLQKAGLLPPVPPPPPPSSGAVPLPMPPFPPRPASGAPIGVPIPSWKSIDVNLNSNDVKR